MSDTPDKQLCRARSDLDLVLCCDVEAAMRLIWQLSERASGSEERVDRQGKEWVVLGLRKVNPKTALAAVTEALVKAASSEFAASSLAVKCRERDKSLHQNILQLERLGVTACAAIP